MSSNYRINPFSKKLERFQQGTFFIQYTFASTALRDAYFISNPTLLKEYVVVEITTDPAEFYQYLNDTWVSINPLVQGPKGDKGDTGTGDVVGPASATNNGITRFDGTTGKLLQDSVVSITDTGGVDGVASLTFNTAAGVTPNTGQISWNSDEETVDVGVNGGVVIQVGQELLYPVINQTGSSISNGTLVMFAGTLGASGKLKIAPAVTDGTYPGQVIMGITTEDIANGDTGYVTHFGKVRGINTTGTYIDLAETIWQDWSDGDVLYNNPVKPGGLTNVEPQAPNLNVTVAVVVNAHSNGTLFTRVRYQGSLSALNDVDGTPLVTSGQILVWDNDRGVFDFNYNITDYSETSHVHPPSEIATLETAISYEDTGDYSSIVATATVEISLLSSSERTAALAITNAGSGVVTLTPNGSDTINGEAEMTLDFQWSSVTLYPVTGGYVIG